MNKNNKLKNIPTFIMMYGFSASGKTTFAKAIVQFSDKIIKGLQKEIQYVSADEIRKELYGSQDVYGNGEEIYNVALNRILDFLENGQDVIYDACNLYLSYRMDFLRPIQEADINCKKIIIRMNTDKDTCIERHEERGRNFDINKAMKNFLIDEPPSLEEGWDEIMDETCTCNALRFYISSLFLNEVQGEKIYEVAETLRMKGHCVYIPYEHNFSKLTRKENFQEITEALHNCDIVICLAYDGQYVGWEVGYAHAKNKEIITVNITGDCSEDVLISGSSLVIYDRVKDLYNNIKSLQPC